jgi:hypothetical protein
MFLKMNKHMKESKLQPIPRARAETLLQLEPELNLNKLLGFPTTLTLATYLWQMAACIHMHRAMYPGVCDHCITPLCGMGHSAEFCYVLWATVQNFVMCYGPQ